MAPAQEGPVPGADGQGPRDEGAADQGSRAEGAAGQVHHNNVNQYFYGALDATQALFGIGSADSANARRRAVGRLDAGEADVVLASYVEPPCFDEAVLALQQDGVVVLVGPPGTGKRSGAVALVAAVAGGREYVVLSPGRSLEDLATGRPAFEKGVGYVLLDRMHDGPSGTADFDWRRVRDTVRESGAHLVVTTVHQVEGEAPGSVRHVPWQLPDLAAVLRVRLVRAGCAGDTVEQAVALLPAGCGITEVAVAADRIARGSDPAEVWREYGSSAARPVRDWFAAERSLQELAEVTTLAFVTGAGYRDFETCQERLEEWLAPAVWEPPAEGAAADAPRPAVDRRFSLNRNTLVAVEKRKQGALTRTVLVFPNPQYRQWVLEELWATRSTSYWNGVRNWLTELLRTQPDPGLQLSVAAGLALLARPAFDEVAESCLHPWAGGAAGPAGQSTATLVLQWMCLDEGLAAIALGVARDWVRAPDPALWSTATTVFSGALGVRFPTDAVHTLLRLIGRRAGRPMEAAAALADLVSVLAECHEDTGVVFRALAYRLAVQRGTLAAGHRKESTLDAVLTVLRARDTRTGRLVCAEVMERQPELIDKLGELWAGVLGNRPRQALALRGLNATLRALPTVCEQPEPVAARFGDALGTALQPTERRLLSTVLRPIAARPDEPAAPLIDTFLTAVLSTED
ncbi:hypothetical protein [Streptomyces sp. TP-A0356]|uniref:hypothetical protein n=1 Tax=Streptomyces sp. TP-A0356 TaxID=1359208 RepID=UPI001F48B012|nr:hypothetical protein [Streptomyces sp. TP-A0356]